MRFKDSQGEGLFRELLRSGALPFFFRGAIRRLLAEPEGRAYPRRRPPVSFPYLRYHGFFYGGLSAAPASTGPSFAGGLVQRNVADDFLFLPGGEREDTVESEEVRRPPPAESFVTEREAPPFVNVVDDASQGEAEFGFYHSDLTKSKQQSVTDDMSEEFSGLAWLEKRSMALPRIRGVDPPPRGFAAQPPEKSGRPAGQNERQERTASPTGAGHDDLDPLLKVREKIQAQPGARSDHRMESMQRAETIASDWPERSELPGRQTGALPGPAVSRDPSDAAGPAVPVRNPPGVPTDIAEHAGDAGSVGGEAPAKNRLPNVSRPSRSDAIDGDFSRPAGIGFLQYSAGAGGAPGGLMPRSARSVVQTFDHLTLQTPEDFRTRRETGSRESSERALWDREGRVMQRRAEEARAAPQRSPRRMHAAESIVVEATAFDEDVANEAVLQPRPNPAPVAPAARFDRSRDLVSRAYLSHPRMRPLR